MWVYTRPSSWIQFELASRVSVSLRRLTPAGCRLRYCAWLGTPSHSQPMVSEEPAVPPAADEIPVLRHARSPANSPLAFAGGTRTAHVSCWLSPMYMTPKSEFSGWSGPTLPPGGAFGSPGGAPLSRNVVVALSGRSSAVPAVRSAPSASSAVPVTPSGPGRWA